MKLNLGCGSQVPSGWVNVDYALGARLARLPLFRVLNRKLHLFRMEWDDRIFIHNLTKGFPWGECTAEIVYSSHTLEHMSREQGREFLRQCHRVLKPGGKIRIVVPDLSVFVSRYLNGEIQAENFVEDLGVLYTAEEGGLKSRLAPFIQYPHKCMYDTPALKRILAELGFEARERNPFDSDIDNIESIELESRTRDAVIVEGVKP